MRIVKKSLMCGWTLVCVVGAIILLYVLFAAFFGVRKAYADGPVWVTNNAAIIAEAKNVAWNKLTPVQRKAVVNYELDRWADARRYVEVGKVEKDFLRNSFKAETTYRDMWELKGTVVSISSAVLYVAVKVGSIQFTVSKADPTLENIEVGTPVAVLSGGCKKTLGVITCKGYALINGTEGRSVTPDEGDYMLRAFEQQWAIDSWNGDNVAGYLEGSTMYRRKFR